MMPRNIPLFPKTVCFEGIRSEHGGNNFSPLRGWCRDSSLNAASSITLLASDDEMARKPTWWTRLTAPQRPDMGWQPQFPRQRMRAFACLQTACNKSHGRNAEGIASYAEAMEKVAFLSCLTSLSGIVVAPSIS
jgi:hypothetical protein